MVFAITPEHLQRLVEIESGVHYRQPPPPGRPPYLLLRRPSPVLFSAPHGARTYRNSRRQIWHDEEDYTAGIALLLGELCQASVIATLWQTGDADPSFSEEARSAYKQEIRRLAQAGAFRLLIDLHGVAEDSPHLLPSQLVDLGTRKERQSLPPARLARLAGLLERRLGPGAVSHNAFPAYAIGRTLTAYCHAGLGVPAVQVELKPSVRVATRRSDSTAYVSRGPYAAPPEKVAGLLQALVEFATENVDRTNPG